MGHSTSTEKYDIGLVYVRGMWEVLAFRNGKCVSVSRYRTYRHASRKARKLGKRGSSES